MVLACTALVLGYERHDLRARFGAIDARPWLSSPPDDDAPPTLAERLAVYPMVILLWGALYEAVAAAGLPSDAISTVTAFEARVPVIEQTEAVYALTYPFVLLAPARRARSPRLCARSPSPACWRARSSSRSTSRSRSFPRRVPSSPRACSVSSWRWSAPWTRRSARSRPFTSCGRSSPRTPGHRASRAPASYCGHHGIAEI